MTSPLYTLTEIANALDSFPPGMADAPVTGVSMDSRTLQPGDLFVALSGTPTGGFKSSFANANDGHDYVLKAQEAGAAAAIVSRYVEGVTIPQFKVDDTLMDGLWKLAAYARNRFTGRLVGITGSAGKTTTKEMTASGLAKVGPTSASTGGLNNFWGVPLTLCRLPKDAQFAVVEMGMNQPGEIARLSTLAKPHVAVVVNVKPVHVAGLGGLEGVRVEKLSIAAGLQQNGVLVVPADLNTAGIPPQTRTITFGENGDVKAQNHQAENARWNVQADAMGTPLQLPLEEGAPHRLHNALAALAVGKALNLSPTQLSAMATGIGAVVPLVGRGAAEEVNGILVVDDSFNGNPASVKAALQSMAARPLKGKRYAVLGDMLELGPEEVAYHKGLLEDALKMDGLFCVGTLMRNLYDLLPDSKKLGYEPDPTKFNPAILKPTLQPGDAVVLKGSKKMLYVNQAVPRLKASLQER
jgi:UDP-N-acetylmuramoyl-tripeptide--D-alanyl-D-alanine ligase